MGVMSMRLMLYLHLSIHPNRWKNAFIFGFEAFSPHSHAVKKNKPSAKINLLEKKYRDQNQSPYEYRLCFWKA